MPGKTALKAVDLEIPQGSMFALLGPNGAGKSTLINILAGIVIKSAGTAKIWGVDIDRDPRQARAGIGIVPQELNIDAFFTPRELLDLQAGLFGVPRAERRTDVILEMIGLADKADSYSRTLSGGMRRRLLVGKAMVHNPPVLVLDEPTAGVDIELRQKLWENVRELNAAGVTVLLTTHYLQEAEELCDQIAIINHGEIIACDSKVDLLKRIDHKEVFITLAEEIGEDLPAPIREFGAVLSGPRQLHFSYKPSEVKISTILAAIRASNLTIEDITTQESDLEDIFLELTRSGDASDDHDRSSAA